ncbi:MAG: carboxylating nicotinate-nucleotide diphosphorylase [Candidatus Margulisbacteria bacterium]|jgi:nicotinate-nucleotide pyrophosphorylase (carboxylating)|nr:carboxylating nicotinate-nucleotide diphosphorylase [Candidatus Margulisiibacteriota bacterium]
MGLSQNTRNLIRAALREDAPRGDITSRYFGSRKTPARAKIIAKASGVLCGLEAAQYCFTSVSRRTVFQARQTDGARIQKGETLATVQGRLNDLLLAERTALNLLQHLSGIATETRKMTGLLRGSRARLLDTRKTTPGLRELEKYAVAAGGGQNHRLNLSAMVLIKDNHLTGLSLPELRKRIIYFKRRHKKAPLEIEAASLSQVKNFLRLPVDIILLDNMPLSGIRKAVKLRGQLNPACRLEISGGVNARTLPTLAKTGVDYISCGRITHSAPALDISLLIQ